MNNFTVYIHHFPNGLKYVGITSQSTEDRWRLGSGYSQQYVYQGIKEFGWDNIQHEIYQTGLTQEEANFLEKYLIKTLNSLIPNGYNVSLADYYNNADVFKKYVSCYDYNGDLIRSYPSISLAAKENGLAHGGTIGQVCKGKIKTAAGLFWAYGVNPTIPIADIKKSTFKIDQYDLNGNYITTYDSTKEIIIAFADITKIKHQHILEVCHHKRNTAYGYQWRFYTKDHNACEKLKMKHDIITQYDLMGHKLYTFNSLAQATLATKIAKETIKRHCLMKQPLIVNIDTFFRFGDAEQIEPAIRHIDQIKRAIYQYDLNWNYVATFESAKSASVKLTNKDTNTENIRAVALGKRKQALGYFWSYDYINKGT